MESHFLTEDKRISITGGGKSGEILRNKNWSVTSLGNPTEWPKELFTSLEILLNSPIPMMLCWGEDMVCFFNDAFLSGQCIRISQPVIGKKAKDVLPDIWDTLSSSIERVTRTGETLMQRDGRFSFSPVFGNEENITGVFIMCMERSEKLMPVRPGKGSEQQLQKLISNISAGIVLLMGKNMRVAVVNDAYAKLIGHTTADIIDKPIFDILPEAALAFMHIIENVRLSGKSYYQNDHPYSVCKKSIKTEGYIDLAYHPYQDDNGLITGVIVICHDVTEQVLARKKSEHIAWQRGKELDEAHKELLNYNNELEQLAYITSHDFQEPARKITVFIDLLEKSLEGSNEQCRTYIEKIKKSSKRSLSLIQDVLAYSQLSILPEKIATIDLQQVIESCEAEYKKLIEEKNAKIICTDLPEIDAVPLQMKKLFGNLISNALKFCSSDEAPLINITCFPLTKDEIHLNKLDQTNRYYYIQVKDKGIGFDQESADRIFKICHRLHSKEKYDGTGVGLAICKKIVHNHRGKIFATSESGRGATFHLIIPRHQSFGTQELFR
jgi:PAS domain S-box-containing protein